MKSKNTEIILDDPESPRSSMCAGCGAVYRVVNVTTKEGTFVNAADIYGPCVMCSKCTKIEVKKNEIRF